MKNGSEIATWLLVFSWLGTGIVATVAGFCGFFYPPLSLVLLVPASALLFWLLNAIPALPSVTVSDKLMIAALVVVWLVHFTGVLVPETGFDAVWYHLPLTELMTTNHSFVVKEEMYQTLNPLFSDAIFALGFQVAREIGAKTIAFAFGLSLLASTYRLARIFLNVSTSLLFLLVVSTFQVISWQVSSFYIDVAKAFFEVSAVWALISGLGIRTRTLSAGLLLGASVASKLFSTALIPVFWLMQFIIHKPRFIQSVVLVSLGVLVIALPFYFRTYYYSGGLLLSGEVFFTAIPEINQQSSPIAYVLARVAALPYSLWILTFQVRDYVTILYLVGLPIVMVAAGQLFKDKKNQALVIFSLVQYCIWWFIPPLSTRYALSGFITLLLVYFQSFVWLVRKRPDFALSLVLTILLAVGINFAPRLLVLKRNLEYVQNQPPLAEYVSQFYDGWIDDKLKTWYRL